MAQRIFLKFGVTLDWDNWKILQMAIFDICP